MLGWIPYLHLYRTSDVIHKWAAFTTSRPYHCLTLAVFPTTRTERPGWLLSLAARQCAWRAEWDPFRTQRSTRALWRGPWWSEGRPRLVLSVDGWSPTVCLVICNPFFGRVFVGMKREIQANIYDMGLSRNGEYLIFCCIRFLRGFIDIMWHGDCLIPKWPNNFRANHGQVPGYLKISLKVIFFSTLHEVISMSMLCFFPCSCVLTLEITQPDPLDNNRSVEMNWHEPKTGS